MLVEIDESNHHIHLNLIQAYEAEFSLITGKLPNKNGIFELDTIIGLNIKGYLWYHDKNPVGFILFDLTSLPFNVNEFYIVPACRQKKLGRTFFLEILKKHSGEWQVKQLQGAHKATEFWRKVIKDYTNDNYKEEIYLDKYWGQVTRQIFRTI